MIEVDIGGHLSGVLIHALFGELIVSSPQGIKLSGNTGNSNLNI
jgi:hypothetical protein